MIRDQNSMGYREVYDGEALREIAQMAVRDVVKEEFGDFLKVKGAKIPNGDFSDFSCNVWSLMKALVNYGINLEREMQDSGVVNCTAIDSRFQMEHPALIGDIEIEWRE